MMPHSVANGEVTVVYRGEIFAPRAAAAVAPRREEQAGSLPPLAQVIQQMFQQGQIHRIRHEAADRARRKAGRGDRSAGTPMPGQSASWWKRLLGAFA